MGPLPVVPNHIRINFGQTDITGLPVGSRVFWRYSGSAPANSDCTAIAAQWRSLADTNLVPLMASGDMEVSATVTDLSTTSGAVGSSTGTSTSSRSGGALPIGTAAVINHLMALHYRGGKPRTYLQIGTSADLVTQAEWSSTFIASVNTAWAAMVTGMNGFVSGGTTLVQEANISYYSGFTVVTSPTTGRARNVPTKRVTPVATDISSSSCALKLGSQRRRYQR
jgi:hypothetical protein